MINSQRTSTGVAARTPASDAPGDSPADRIHLAIGRRIRAARLQRGMSLADLGGQDLSRSFLSLVELGRSRISLRALSIVAARLGLPISYFLDDPPAIHDISRPKIDEVRAALAYSYLLRSRGETEEALEYALWAAETRLRDS